MERMQTIFAIIFGIIFVVGIIMFIFTMIIFISPKARGKWMARQYKSMKYMVDESKDDIEHVNTTMANASKEGVKTTAKAIKEGFTEDEDIHCKHCGEIIDNDSKFCKKCGKEQ